MATDRLNTASIFAWVIHAPGVMGFAEFHIGIESRIHEGHDLSGVGDWFVISWLTQRGQNHIEISNHRGHNLGIGRESERPFSAKEIECD